MVENLEFEKYTELTSKNLERKIKQYPQSLDTVPVDPRRYTILFQSEVSYQGKLYQLIYKTTKPNDNQVITRLSLVGASIAKKTGLKVKLLKDI